MYSNLLGLRANCYTEPPNSFLGSSGLQLKTKTFSNNVGASPASSSGSSEKVFLRINLRDRSLP